MFIQITQRVFLQKISVYAELRQLLKYPHSIMLIFSKQAQHLMWGDYLSSTKFLMKDVILFFLFVLFEHNFLLLLKYSMEVQYKIHKDNLLVAIKNCLLPNFEMKFIQTQSIYYYFILKLNKVQAGTYYKQNISNKEIYNWQILTDTFANNAREMKLIFQKSCLKIIFVKDIQIQIKMTAKINSEARFSQINDITHQQIKEIGCQQLPEKNSSDQKKKMIIKYIIIGSVAVLVISLILGVTLGILLTRKLEPEPQPQPQPQPYVFRCQDSPSECSGVQSSVRDYIFQNYTEPDTVRALLQVARNFQGVQDTSRQNLTDTYMELVRSIECLAYNLPDAFSQAYSNITQLQFTTEESLISYLNMTYSFSGLPLRLMSSDSVMTTCNFHLTSVSSSRGRYLQQACSTNSSNSSAVLIYFDGNGGGPGSAVRNLQKITQLIEQNSQANFDQGVISVGNYRQNGQTNFFLTVVTTFMQKLQETNRQVPSRLSLLQCLRIFTDLTQLSGNVPSDMIEQLVSQFYSFFGQQSALQLINYATNFQISRHKQFVTQQTSEGKKVVLVAHAEGTLYANSVFNLLSAAQKQSVGLVYIAPFTHAMADGLTNYISNPLDTVIAALTTIATGTSEFQTPLPPNMESMTFNSPLGNNHDLPGYVRAYKTQLISLIVSVKNRITQPAQTLGSGPITIQLRWDNQPDLDLHVFEPNNVHVYYSNRIGVTGFLDLDDTDGYGPQHYYTNCSTMVPGEYRVGVNYYRGSAVSTLSISVSAGTQYFMKTMNLTTPLSTTGNANPTHICNITVNAISAGLFTYSITQ